MAIEGPMGEQALGQIYDDTASLSQASLDLLTRLQHYRARMDKLGITNHASAPVNGFTGEGQSLGPADVADAISAFAIIQTAIETPGLLQTLAGLTRNQAVR